MVEKRVEVTMSDPNSYGVKVLSNILDPINLSVLIDRIKNTSEKRSLEELVESLMEGK